MMRTGRVLILLSLLTVLVLARAGLSMWTDPWIDQQAVNEVAISDALAASGENTNQGAPLRKSDSGLMSQAIPEAEALPFTPDAEAISQAERETLLSPRKTRDELNARQKALEERQAAAEASEKLVNERIADLEELETRIKDMLSQEQSINTKKIKRLTAVYEGMKADRAAPVLAKMDLPTVVRMFSRMDEKKVGKILSFLPPDKAVVITQALTRRISD
ncbi:MAG: hypothetical protein Q9M30_00785, partial [Mariprofundaceae bacterium]|nr:hypothetical protein [Mariprofundaceae bacterium]